MNNKSFTSNSFNSTGYLSILAALLWSGQAFASSAHFQITGPFQSAEEANRKCLECHNQEAQSFKNDLHWTWQRPRKINNQVQDHGKRDSLTHYAISAPLNKDKCMTCHPSTSPGEFSFEDNSTATLDCLVCHDTTGSYRRNTSPQPTGSTDLDLIVRNAGKATTDNCMTCHLNKCWNSGTSASAGDTTAFSRQDIHMASRKINFSCTTCHVSGKEHSFSSRNTGNGSMRIDSRCTSCHTLSPHSLDRLNLHTNSIACQTCHIPHYGADRPVVVTWNWSLAGKAQPIAQQNTDISTPLLDEKGLVRSMNIIPAYRWDDGSETVYMRGDRINSDTVTSLREPAAKGSDTGGSVLAPFSVTYATQLYDQKYRYLISPLFPFESDMDFTDSQWNGLAKEGMDALRLPFSGSYGFTATATYRRLNHGVAPAKDALDCMDCHGKHGRMNWNQLGYQNDPWSRQQPGGTAPESLPVSDSSKMTGR